MSQTRLGADFVQGASGRILVVSRAPATAERSVLFVPAFGEEMNKCRRQVTETAEMLAKEGVATLVIDLSGTGDSEGEFADATWSGWRSDVRAVMTWAEENGPPIESLVSTRLGCVLAAESLRDGRHRMRKSVFWQPVPGGRQFIKNFLRLRVAASMMEADTKESVDGLREKLQSGETLEVAGYALSPALWREIETTELSNVLSLDLGELAIFEVGGLPGASLSVATQRLKTSAEEQGIPVAGQRFAGEPFWTSTEIVVNPELTAHTVQFLTERAVS